MRRLFRLVLTAAFLAGALAVRSIAAPGTAFACSCLAPDPAAPAFSGEEQVVFVGKAGLPQPDGTQEFAVEQWFKGGAGAVVRVESEREVLPDGSTTINTCGLHFEVADRLIMAASLDGNVLVPGLCSPHAVVDSPEGQRLIAAAVQTFGEGRPPGAGFEDSADESPIDLASIALGGVAVLLIVGLLVVGLAVRGGRAGDAPS